MAKKGQIYTRRGDDGTCALFGGSRVDKDDIRVECFGTFDEANSSIGVLRSQLPIDHPWQTRLHEIQYEMMNMMSRLATPNDCPKENENPLPVEGAKRAEEWMDEIEAKLATATDTFLLPGGSQVSALCHLVRTQFRRAERRLITLHKREPVDPSILRYTNRLSDLFFKLAREELASQNLPEEKWKLFLYKKPERKAE